MEFWGVEVKCGEPSLVEPGEGMVLHLSQANLGEAKKDKGGESICIQVTVDGKKLVLATLNTDKLPQQQFDLIFDRDFEISHNWKNGSVFFYGYMATNPVDEDEDSSDGFESDEDIPLHTSNGTKGKPDTKSKPEKPVVAEKANAAKDSASGKQKVKIAEPKKGAKDEDDSVSSDEDEDMDDEEDSETGEGEDGSDSGDDDSEEESEETPKKVESGKKRPSESSKKTPVPEKKVKMATPQKTDGKKSGSEHVATPHPSKKAGKTPAGNKENQKTPKSGGSHLCKSCNRSFGSEGALDSHSKAKHSAGK